MLYLYQSNRLETLADIFCVLHQQLPLSQALVPEEVVVQSQGMRRYLNQYLAGKTGIAANLRFSLPAGLSWRLMRELLLGIPELSPFHPEVLRWRLFDLFQNSAFHEQSVCPAAYRALHGYLGSSDTAAYQLAGQLADIFDQYLVYRPQWIESWQSGGLYGLGDDEIWQAELWRYLDDGGNHAPHRVALWQQLLGALDAEHLPERFFVFGIATMAPMYLQLLQALAEHCDVHIFALNPSSHYWGNVIEAAQILKSEEDTDLSQSGHPLLASLGKQGRDFFDALTEAGVAQERSFYVDSESQAGMLQQLQQDIQNLVLPGSEGNCLPDGTIRIRCAHSPLRELQILKEELLEVLAANPDWQPHDIAVLTPNIEPYSPYIEAVFGQAQGSAQALPYSVSDVRLSRRQPLLYALEQILALFDSRFEVDKILPLLESNLILRRFNLTHEDLPLLHTIIAELNIRWGLDGNMRRNHGADDNLFTWQQGLDRLVLGWMLPEGDQSLWEGVSAWHSEPNQLAVLSQFSAFLNALAKHYRLWQQAADTAQWCARVRGLLGELFAPEEDDQAAVQQIEQSLVRWQEEASLAQFEGALPLHTVIRHIGRFLDSESEAGFLRGGITFCSMVPMRSLPFRMICLLGLNDGDYPRNTKAAGFDLISRYPQKGDRARRDDDRYLFLEAILSAREILYLSYIGRDIQNNEILAPSSLLSELIDTLAAMAGMRSSEYGKKYIVQHPLQVFSRRYFDAESGYRSSRADYADALNRPLNGSRPFFDGAFTKQQDTAETLITQSDFLSFWRNPVRAWLQGQLGWREPYRDEAWEAAEPFEPNRSDIVYAEYTEARRTHADFGSVGHRLRAQSLLPPGELGRLWQQRFEIAAKSLDGTLCLSRKLPPQAYTLMLAGYALEGSLGHCYQHGQIFFLDSQPYAPQKISLYLQHLIFCAVRPSESPCFESHILYPDHHAKLPAITQENACKQLEKWLDYFRIGQSRPLPFFAKTSFAVAERLLATDDREAAENEAFSQYLGSKMSKGQCDYTEVRLVFGHDDALPIETPLFWNLIENLVVPLLEVLATDKTEDSGTV
ncbi:exodeoxyribonuclease V subunit gamma [Neisseria sp. S1]|uniref:exodeoxyribonuclease V subunit gamma n=1 Tax=Neisseria sp. S1 TaxID=3318354 RepID=UPI003A84E749